MKALVYAFLSLAIGFCQAQAWAAETDNSCRATCLLVGDSGVVKVNVWQIKGYAGVLRSNDFKPRRAFSKLQQECYKRVSLKKSYNGSETHMMLVTDYKVQDQASGIGPAKPGQKFLAEYTRANTQNSCKGPAQSFRTAKTVLDEE
jgi:hypothetical protein